MIEDNTESRIRAEIESDAEHPVRMYFKHRMMGNLLEMMGDNSVTLMKLIIRICLSSVGIVCCVAVAIGHMIMLAAWPITKIAFVMELCRRIKNGNYVIEESDEMDD